MTTRTLRPVAAITLTDGVSAEALQASEGSVGLDATRVPYASAEFTVPLVSSALVETIDPYAEQRVTIRGADDAAGTERVFDLGLRSREVDHKARTIRISVASDEALLEDYAKLAADAAPRGFESSLRDVIDYVLGQVIPGATLEPGDADPDVTAHWRVDNVLRDPSAEVTVDNWSAAGNCSIFLASIGRTGTGSCGFTSTAAGELAVTPMKLSGRTAVTPARSYMFNGYGQRGLSSAIPPGATMSAVLRWVDVNGDSPWPEIVGTPVALGTGGWGPRAEVTGVAPAGSVAVFPYFRVFGATGAGQIGYVDDAMFHEGTEAVPFFTGSTAEDDDYEYEWGDAANDSTSTRIPKVERLPELFTWGPGVSAWTFLEPLTSAVGLRLFSDEARRWWLVDPAAYSMPGRLTLGSWNATEGTDSITRDDASGYATGVVVQYSWTDDDDIARTAIDAAGLPGRVAVVPLNRPYPGPGAAAAILARRAGQGRTQDVTALADWSAVPAQEVGISLPGTDPQVGQIASVEWGLTGGLMKVIARGLTEVAPGSIAALVDTIDDLVGTIDSL